MKLRIEKSQFNELPILNKLFLAKWKEKKGYPVTKEWCPCQMIELAQALSHDFSYDYPAERTTFNNGLHYQDLFLGYDGPEFTDTLWYELNQKLRRRINGYLVMSEG